MAFAPIRFLPKGGIAGGALPWVIGVMVYLCGLAAGFGLAVNAAVGDWAASLSREISVQVVHPDAAERQAQADAAMAVLEKTPGIAAVTPVSDAEAAALLEPWLGAGNVTADLPIPILLDVRLAPGVAIDVTALEAAVKAAAPAAALDDHERWLTRLNRLAGALETVAAAVVGLIFAATAAIAAFGTRAGLASHKDSIEIMHHMGAEDRVIAGEFRHRFMVQGLKGGIGGIVFAAATLLITDRFAEQLGRGLIPALDLSAYEWLALALLPVFAALLTRLSAQITVRRELAKLP